MGIFNKGYIYLGFDQTSYGIKIGKSKDWAKRQEQIRNMNPTFTIFRTFFVDDMGKTEKLLHRTFKQKQLISEWFDLTARDVANIIEILTDDDVSEDTIRLIATMTGVRIE